MEQRQKITLLQEVVSIEERAIRTGYKSALAVFAAGVVGAGAVSILAPGEMGPAKLALTICTGFGSLISSTLPVKDVPSKRAKIKVLSFLKSEYEYFQTQPPNFDELRIAEVEKRFSNFLDKNL